MNVPAKMRIELTRRCNLHCIHCKVVCEPDPRGELDAADLRDILPQLKKAGAFQLNLTGGEIFARPDILELLDVVFSFDFLVNIQSNATLIGAEHIELLKRNRDRIVRVATSVYAADPAVHESVTRVPGSFQKTVDTIFALRDAGVEAAVFCLLMAENAPYYKQTQEFFERNKIHYQFATLLVAREDGCAGPLEHKVDEETLGELPVDWDRYLNPDPLSVPDHYPPETPICEWCIAGRFPNILPNGDLAPCSVIRTPVGNLREHSFEDLYLNSPLFNKLRALTVGDLDCKDCEYFPRCKPCIGISHDEHGSYTARPSEYCRLTRKYLSKK